MTTHNAAPRNAFIIVLAALCASPAVPAAPKSQLDDQRALFRDVFPSVERGDWSRVDALSALDRQLLEAYALWPDLRATWLRAKLKSAPHADIESFLTRYGALRPARELRYRHSLNLARQGDLAGYLRIYESFYQGQNVAKLDCLALQAHLAAGRNLRVNTLGMDLWLVGNSQVDECDPVFNYMRSANLLDRRAHEGRYALAIEQRNFSLARWLGKQIDQRHVDTAGQWLRARDNPEQFLTQKRRQADNAVLREQLVYATERLTFRDPLVAAEHWSKVARRYSFSEAQKLRTVQHIALWTARDKLPNAYSLLRKLPPAAQSDEVLRWRARVSLREAKWTRLLADIDTMSDEERSSEEWQYWHAIARRRSDTQQDTATSVADTSLQNLSEERSYYGFLAADAIGDSYALDDAALLADEARIAEIAARPRVVRARELFFVGQDGRGRSEWGAVTRYLSDNDKMQAAILADRWGWHSRAIATAASIGEYDDLSLRYPLPFQESFTASSSKAQISPTWAYGIARSESLFMRDVRSSAGAIGLMQLMPATGREVARSIKVPYTGLNTLTNPDTNIQLGTQYLAQMAERYGGNAVLATAAYNAGPHRVDRWLPEQGNIDARIWIENIPFNETRGYVKRVLAAQTIFHWRLTGKVRRLSDELPLVQPPSRNASNRAVRSVISSAANVLDSE